MSHLSLATSLRLTQRYVELLSSSTSRWFKLIDTTII